MTPTRFFHCSCLALLLLAACSTPPPTGAADVASAPAKDADAATDVAAPADATPAVDTLAAADAVDAAPVDASAPPADAAPADVAAPLPTCPTAVILFKEGEEVIPQTMLHLEGDKSLASNGGKIAKYQWTVTQPAGSNQKFVPSDTYANPTFQANAAGEYIFCLDVWDDLGLKSCQPACKTLMVLPSDAIHVELLWDTPADPDQTDGTGADLDLHFTHPLATGPDLDCDGKGDPWFNNPFDCFWFNPNPNWASMNPSAEDDPNLDLDDTDGAGPENLNLAKPEGTAAAPVKYSGGVHYWNDYGFGVSYATVSVYVQGSLALQINKVKMEPADMWYVGTLNWPNQLTGDVLPVFTTCKESGNACLAPGQPGAGQMWQAAGDWCITHCYENKAFTAAAGGKVTWASCKAP